MSRQKGNATPQSHPLPGVGDVEGDLVVDAGGGAVGEFFVEGAVGGFEDGGVVLVGFDFFVFYEALFFGFDAVEECSGRLIVGVLRYKFALYRLLQYGLLQLWFDVGVESG